MIFEGYLARREMAIEVCGDLSDSERFFLAYLSVLSQNYPGRFK
jgi:hypothetical protein